MREAANGRVEGAFKKNDAENSPWRAPESSWRRAAGYEI
jgi:hypothetical protein